jgi:Peptidase A4 family
MNSKRIIIAVIGVLGVVAAIVAGVRVSSSDPTKNVYPGYPRIPATHAPVGGPRISAPAPGGNTANGASNTSYSYNWSGYAANGSNGQYHSVKASWVQPRIIRTGGSSWQDASFWVGLDGSNSSTVEQLGTEGYYRDGTILYDAWYEMYPAALVTLSNHVQPGDHLTASVSRSGRSYTLTIKDSTEGWSRTIHKTGGYHNSSAEAVAEAPYAGGILPLANFHIAHFTSTAINGKSAISERAGAIDMLSSSGTSYLDTVSPINSAGAWTAFWDSAS